MKELGKAKSNRDREIVNKLLLLVLFSVFVSACNNHLSADEISKMTEEQIKQITPDQIGKMTPGELEIFKERRSHFVSERSRIQREKAWKLNE